MENTPHTTTTSETEPKHSGWTFALILTILVLLVVGAYTTVSKRLHQAQQQIIEERTEVVPAQ
jgi:hypothetical protein